jgi:hypothetical protein
VARRAANRAGGATAGERNRRRENGGEKPNESLVMLHESFAVLIDFTLDRGHGAAEQFRLHHG